MGILVILLLIPVYMLIVLVTKCFAERFVV